MIRFIQNNSVLNINHKVIYLIFLSIIICTQQLYGQTSDFNFNTGNTQKWTLYGPQNTQGTILPSNFSSIYWSNSTNYPNAIGADPTSDSSGSVYFSCKDGTGISDSDTWWIMQFVSPDLSANSDWQRAKGYSVQLTENMSYPGQTYLYANLYVKVHDNDLNTDRYFYNGTAQLLTRSKWNSLSFDWSGDSNFPTNYTILSVFIDIWGTVSGYYSGAVYLDEVKLVSGVPGKPVLISPKNNSINVPVNPTLQWQAVSGATYYDLKVYNEKGYLILHDPDVTSTSRQIDSLGYSSTYIWVVAAGNKYGLGDLSDPFKFTTIAAPFLTVSPPNQDVPYNAGSTTFTVTSNVSWSVSDDASWLTVSPLNSSGNGTITASFPENNTGQRTGTITVTGGGITRKVTVNQAVLWVGPTVSTSSITNITTNSATGGGNVSSQGSSAVTVRGVCWSTSVNPTTSNSKTTDGSGTGSFTSSITGLSPSTKYYVRAYAVNSIGTSYGQQVEFTTLQEPTLTVVPANRDVGYTSGSTTFTVTSNVSWSVSDNASWLTVSPTSGSGNNTLTATYTENTTTSSRIGTITIKDSAITRTVTVTQAAGPVRLTVTPSDRPVPYTSGSTTFTVTSNVNWSSSDDASWLTLNLSGGTGNATLTASYTENTSASQRTATITVTGGIPGYSQITRTVTVTQAGKPTLTVTPSDRQVSNSSGNVPFYVTSNVNWNVTDNASWLSVSPVSGSGNGTLTATYSANSAGNTRVGTITVTDGKLVSTVTVTQSGTELYVSPVNRSVPNTSGKTSFTVTSNASWSVSDNASWLTVSPTSGSGNGTLTAAFTENTSANERIGTITVVSGGLSVKVTVTQAPAPLLIISPSELHVSYLSGSKAITIVSNVSWNVTDNAAWINVSPTSGSNDGTITASFTENTLTSQRIGTIIVTGGGLTDSVNIIQDPAPILSISPQERQVSYPAGSTNFTIKSNVSWSVADDASWLTLNPSSGSGNGTLTASYTENTTNFQRKGTIILTGGGLVDTVFVIQAFKTELAVSPKDQPVSYKSGSTTFSVATNLDWKVSDDAIWLTVSPAGGSGNGTITASFTENTSSSQRIGRIIVAGGGKADTVTVTQSEASLLTVTPSNRNVSYAAGKTTFAVTSNINWSVIDDADWLTVSPTGSGGNGTLTAAYTENISTSQRIATIIVAGGGKADTVTVTQSEASLLTVTPSNRNVSYAAGKTTFAVTSNINWSVSDDAEWLTVSPAGSGGNGTITAVYTENSSASQRIGTIIVAGGGKADTVTVTQSEASLLTVTPSNRNVSYAAGKTTFAVTSNLNWSVSDDADWLTVSPAGSSGNGTITAAYTENTSASQRIGRIIVTGGGKADTVTVTQSEASLLTVVPSNRNVSYTSGQTTFAVTSNVNWKVGDDADWLTVSPAASGGNGTLTAAYTENTSANQRIGTIIVTGGGKADTVTITQAPAPLLSVVPSNRNVPYTSGQTTFALKSSSSWSVRDDANWLIVSPARGSGNSTLTAAYTENTSTNQRIGTIIVTGDGKADTVTVTQAPASLLTVVPSNRNVSFASGQTTFAVTSSSSWSVSDDADWLTVSPTNGNGNGTLTAVFTENTSANQRIGKITIVGAGKIDTITVTQSAAPLLTVVPANRNVSYTSGQTTFEITSNASWSVSDDAEWLTVSPVKGTGNETLTATFTENITTSQRIGTITVSGGIKSTVKVIQAFRPVASIITSVNTLSDFGDVELGENSVPQNYSVSGNYLTADIEITSPAGFYISLNSNSGYSNKITLPQSGGSVPSTTIYVKFIPAEVQAYSGSIIHKSTGAAQTNVDVYGYGLINYPTEIPINVSYVFPNPAQASNYKIIGLPGANDIPIINILKSANVGSGDWRAFWDPGYGDYIEYDGSNLFNFTPGRAFWIISKNTININTNAESVNLSDNHTYSIPVHNEWNLISNPFNKTISWDEIRGFNPGLSEPIYYFESGNYIISDSLEQYKGYYFYNNPVLSMKSINIPYIDVPSNLPKKKIAQDRGLEILLFEKGEKINEVRIGFSDSASAGLDYLDKFSPPSNFCDVSLALLNTGISTNYKYLSAEYRPVIGRGQKYNLIVKNTTNENLLLDVNGTENFLGYELYIWDEESMKLYDLRKTKELKVVKNTVNKEYRLFIGTEDYIAQIRKGLIPNEFKLFQNFPNPFNPVTTIMFSLPQQNKVSLNIYNVLGELVMNLINGKLYEEGYHSVIFDGTKLSSGIYFYKIQIGSFINVKKMVLIK